MGNKTKRGVDFALTRTFYIFGFLQAQGLLRKFDDLDEIEMVCVEVADNWRDMVDIKDFEEEGYPSVYAERVLLEKYGKQGE